DEPVERGWLRRGPLRSIDAQIARDLVDLVLHEVERGDLDERVEDLRRPGTHREAVPGMRAKPESRFGLVALRLTWHRNGARGLLFRRSPDELGHRRRGRAPLLQQTGDRTLAILGRPILTHLPLAHETRQRDLEADDGAEHRVDVVGRGVGDAPGFVARVL